MTGGTIQEGELTIQEGEQIALFLSKLKLNSGLGNEGCTLGQ